MLPVLRPPLTNATPDFYLDQDTAYRCVQYIYFFKCPAPPSQTQRAQRPRDLPPLSPADPLRPSLPLLSCPWSLANAEGLSSFSRFFPISCFCKNSENKRLEGKVQVPVHQGKRFAIDLFLGVWLTLGGKQTITQDLFLTTYRGSEMLC